MTRLKIIYATLLTLTGWGLVSCESDMDISIERGAIRISLENVAPGVLTRSTPSDLGTPLAEGFLVSVRDGSGREVYSAPYSETDIPLPAGQYEVSASYGDNPPIAIDNPYYLGTAIATVEGEAVSPVSVECKVANALVSVRFGRDEEEKARFGKFYDTYALRVYVGDRYVNISDRDSYKSAYFRAGSRVSLAFTGVLAADGREVSMPLDAAGTGFPDVFQAADHAIVTLSLPDPESATVVDVSKAEMEEATMEETIPVSWLPIPQVLPSHAYDADGNLVGTDIAFTNSYPGMEWKAVVSDQAGTTLRTVEGSGELLSAHADNADGWVYVPAGDYTATFYLVSGDKEMKTGTRTFAVANPDLKVAVSAYTSYSRYVEGSVDDANACDAYTIYTPVVSVNIAQSLWNNAKYAKGVTATIDGTALDGADVTWGSSGTVFAFANQTGKTPRFEAYVLQGSLTFDKVAPTGSAEVYVTGLPASWTPPTEGDWSVSGTHDWNGNYNGKDCVRLGQNSGAGDQYIICQKFAVPAGVRIKAPYDVMMHGASVATTLTLSFGGTNYFQERSSSGFMNSKDHYYTDIAYFTTESSVSEAKANNSYGLAQTCSRIYSLSYLYSE